MKVISLNCNDCGAPLDAPEKAKFITCSFCNSRLAIQRTGSSYSTELLEELRDTTQSLADDVAKIKTRSEIEELDRAWELEREDFMVSGKDGRRSLPTKGGSIVGGVMVACIGIFWTIFTSGITAGAPGAARIFPLFGLLFAGFGVVMSFLGYQRADAYERAHREYQDRRQELMRS